MERIKASLENTAAPPETVDVPEICWFALAYNLVLFVPTRDSLPEEQFRVLWHDLLKAAICMQGTPWCVYATLEFRMTKIEAYKKDARVDSAFLLRDRFSDAPVPICLVEAARALDFPTQDHKDYQMLATEMLGCLLNVMGIARNAPYATRKQLRMFGGLASGSRMRWCVLFPVYDNEEDASEFSFVFQADPEWSVELFEADQADQLEGQKAEFVEVVDPELGQVTNMSLDLGELTGSLEHSNRDEDWSPSSPSVPPRFHSLNFDDKHEKVLASVLSMGKHIAEYGDWLRRTLQDLEDSKSLSKPFEIPLQLRQHLQGNRSMQSHTVTTPKHLSLFASPLSARDYICSRVAAKSLGLPLDGELDTHGSLRTRVFASSSPTSGLPLVIVVKPWSDVEVHMLTDRLRTCPNVIKTLAFRKSADHAWLTLLQERTVSVYDYFDGKPSMTRMQHLFEAFHYVVDGLDALLQLQEAGVLHRDISPRNFMYSPMDDRWKLLDLNLACDANDVKVNRGTAVTGGLALGTKDFIAPEVEQGEPHSFATDWYSFGATAAHSVCEPLIGHFLYYSEDELCGLASKLYGICSDLHSPIMERRFSLEKARAQMQTLALEIVELVGVDREGTHYSRWSGGLVSSKSLDEVKETLQDGGVVVVA